MELSKRTPEEQAEIDADKQKPHAVAVLYCELDPVQEFQADAEEIIEQGMADMKRRADRAGMIILSTSISTNVTSVISKPCLTVTILCQWASLEKLEEQQRRAALAGGGFPGRGR